MNLKRLTALTLTVVLMVSVFPVNVLARELTEKEAVSISESEDEIAKARQTDIVQYSYQVSLGYHHSAAIKKDGTLWMWGNNSHGQLECGYINNHNSNVPIKIMDNVAQVSLGRYHSAAIKKDGTLWIWGYNNYGELGNTSTHNSLVSIKIMDNVAQVAPGIVHSAAIKKDGTLWMWGGNFYGQLGNNSTHNSLVPIKMMDEVVQVSLGEDHSAAIKDDGMLWTWGHNNSGQLGNSSTIDSHVPIKIMDGLSSGSSPITPDDPNQLVEYRLRILESGTNQPLEGVWTLSNNTTGKSDVNGNFTIKEKASTSLTTLHKSGYYDLPVALKELNSNEVNIVYMTKEIEDTLSESVLISRVRSYTDDKNWEGYNWKS